MQSTEINASGVTIPTLGDDDRAGLLALLEEREERAGQAARAARTARRSNDAALHNAEALRCQRARIELRRGVQIERTQNGAWTVTDCQSATHILLLLEQRWICTCTRSGRCWTVELMIVRESVEVSHLVAL